MPNLSVGDIITVFGMVAVLCTFPLWLIRQFKAVLFWVYLWQLKEYHIQRFLDHFRTQHGKNLLLNKVIIVKIILLIIPIPIAIFSVYAAEAAKAVRDLVTRRARKPVPTKKARGLAVMGIGVFFLFGIVMLQGLGAGTWSFQETARMLLVIDLALPFVISGIVIGLEPATVFVRKRILEKARKKREAHAGLMVVGITGSYGKTSTKEFLAYILAQKYRVLKTPEHVNAEIGIAKIILEELTHEHEIFVVEMGAYRKGEIAMLAYMTKPTIGIVTGVNEQHLATFGSLENLLSAEGGEELVESLPEKGAVFINQTSRVTSQKYKVKCKKVYSGVAEHVKVEKGKVFFEIEGVTFEVPAYGKHNVQNLLGAIAAAREIGMSLSEIARAALSMPLGLSPLQVIKSAQGITVIDSTYSANPDGVIADLEYLSLYEGKKVLVMPCLIELGSASKEAHKRIGEQLMNICDLAVITTKEYVAEIQEGAKGSDKVVYMESAQDIIKAIRAIEGEKVVLLEGGKESRIQRQLLGNFNV
jgi:UDP-N-acetylmuramoyl-tripeptide--D-alanyl-D-alanine ligase